MNYKDSYEQGGVIDLVVVREKISDAGFVAWNLPDGQRLFTTLAEYNKSFPEVCSNWKNLRNKGLMEKYAD